MLNRRKADVEKSPIRGILSVLVKKMRGCGDPLGLGHTDVGAQVDVLDCVEELDSFSHGALEGFAAGD
jgi:hypothetical protein